MPLCNSSLESHTHSNSPQIFLSMYYVFAVAASRPDASKSPRWRRRQQYAAGIHFGLLRDRSAYGINIIPGRIAYPAACLRTDDSGTGKSHIYNFPDAPDDDGDDNDGRCTQEQRVQGELSTSIMGGGDDDTATWKQRRRPRRYAHSTTYERLLEFRIGRIKGLVTVHHEGIIYRLHLYLSCIEFDVSYPILAETLKCICSTSVAIRNVLCIECTTCVRATYLYCSNFIRPFRLLYPTCSRSLNSSSAALVEPVGATVVTGPRRHAENCALPKGIYETTEQCKAKKRDTTRSTWRSII